MQTPYAGNGGTFATVERNVALTIGKMNLRGLDMVGVL
jgi:hypothetical protein